MFKLKFKLKIYFALTMLILMISCIPIDPSALATAIHRDKSKYTEEENDFSYYCRKKPLRLHQKYCLGLFNCNHSQEEYCLIGTKKYCDLNSVYKIRNSEFCEQLRNKYGV